MKFFLIIFFCINATKASWNDYIFFDGLKFRYGQYNTDHHINSDHVNFTDADEFGQTKVPVMIAWKQKLGSFYFGQLYVDYELPYTSRNMKPESLNLITLQNGFFNTSELSYIASNPNYSMTADFKTWSAILGYRVGLFIPIGSRARFLMVGVGLSLGWYYYDTSLYLCSTYTVAPSKISGNEKSNGTCTDKRFIVSAKYNGIGLGFVGNIVLFQLDFKNSQWTFFDSEFGNISPLSSEEITERGLPLELNMSSGLMSFDFIRYTYFF